MLAISGAGVSLENQSGSRVQGAYARGSTDSAQAKGSATAQDFSPSKAAGSASFADGFAPSLPFTQAADRSNPAGVYKRLFFPAQAEADAGNAAKGDFSLPLEGSGEQGADEAKAPISKGKTAAEVAEDGECETCKNRRYQDGSNDPGVSFKTAGKIDKSVAASTIRAHEQEHVKRNAAKAEREGREVVMSRVVLHTGVCPECGDTFYSGGTTTTVTRKAYDKAVSLDPESGANMSKTTVDAAI